MATSKKRVSAQKTHKPGKPKFGAKADFVRKQPASMSAKEVVEAAKKAGLTMTENHVYNVRSAAKKGGPSRTTRGSRRKAGAVTSSAPEGRRPGSSASNRHRRAGPREGASDFAEVEEAFAGG